MDGAGRVIGAPAMRSEVLAADASLKGAAGSACHRGFSNSAACALASGRACVEALAHRVDLVEAFQHHNFTVVPGPSDMLGQFKPVQVCITTSTRAPSNFTVSNRSAAARLSSMAWISHPIGSIMDLIRSRTAGSSSTTINFSDAVFYLFPGLRDSGMVSAILP